MSRRQQFRTGTIAILLITAMVAVGFSTAGAAQAAPAEPTVSVEHNEIVKPGEQTTITVSGTNANELRLEDETGGWIVNETDPGSLVTFPNPDETPYESQSGDTWGHLYSSTGDQTFEVVVTAPESPGTYNFTAIAIGDETETSQQFSITVSETTVDVEHPDTVGLSEQTSISVNGTDAGELTISGDVARWIVNDTDPAGVSTFPNPGDTPYESQSGDSWGHLYSSTGDHSFEVIVTSPDTAGTYNFTATAGSNASEVDSSFSIVVENRTTHESGVSEEKYDTVAGDDGELSRSDILTAIDSYIGGTPIGEIRFSRDEMLDLIRYYINN